MEATQKVLGTNIAALRRKKGLTQEQLADRLGISAPAVSKWETGVSCPDITLLCPLARALDTNVDTLLQFEQTLPDEEVIRQINAILDDALRRQEPEKEQQLRELLRQYPNCTALQYNGAAAYDAFQAFFPDVGEETRKEWKSRKRALLEQVRAGGSAAYWQGATIQLATIAVGDGDLETGAALLKELPEHIGNPTAAWALYYLKKDEPEQALRLTQKQLYLLVSQTQSCLAMLMNPKLMPRPEQLLKLSQVYGAVARTFGLPDISGAPMMEAWLRMGETGKAAECFARYVELSTGPVTCLDAELFSPGVECRKQEDLQATTPSLQRMLVQSITTEEKYRPLFEEPVFLAALEKLKASL